MVEEGVRGDCGLHLLETGDVQVGDGLCQGAGHLDARALHQSHVGLDLDKHYHYYHYHYHNPLVFCLTCSDLWNTFW